MSIPLVSACCLSYNHSAYIEQNIKALWEQNYKNIEIIALDDASSDNSINILNSLKTKSLVPMQVISQQNSGNIGKNFNTLIAQTKGKYIYFTSCDDIICPEIIFNAVSLMEQDNNMVFVATTRNYVLEHNKNGNLVRKEDTKILQGIRTAQHILDYEYKHLDSFYIQGALFRKEIIDAVKGFDEDMTGDDIVLRIKIARYVKDNPHLRFTMLDNFGFCYRKHGDNIHKNTFRQVKIVAEVMERYYPEMPLSNEVCNWIKCCFEHLPFNKAMECFFINSKTKSLLQDVNNPMLDFVFLRYKLEKKKQTFLYRLTHKYLYNKEKNYSTGVRTVMILYFLKFSYRK